MWEGNSAWAAVVQAEMDERGCVRKPSHQGAWCGAHPLANGWSLHGCTAAEVWARERPEAAAVLASEPRP